MEGGYLLGGLLVEILPCNAGGVGLIPVQGTKIPHAVEQVSLHIVTTESLSHTSRGHAVYHSKRAQMMQARFMCHNKTWHS